MGDRGVGRGSGDGSDRGFDGFLKERCVNLRNRGGG